MILFPATLVYFLVMLDSSIISTAIPEITNEFNSLLDVGWYGSAYQLTSSAFVPLAGKIYTLFSIKVGDSPIYVPTSEAMWILIASDVLG